MKRLLLIALGIAVVAAAGGDSPVPSTGASLRPVQWQELSFGARKFLMGAETTVRVRALADDELKQGLRSPGEAPAVPADGPAVALTLDTDLPFGRQERASAWIDAATGRALQREKLVTGSKHYWKLLRYTTDGFVQWRAEPAGKAEEDLSAEQWSTRSEQHHKWQAEISGQQVVTDSYALLYLLSAARFDRPDTSLEILVPSRGRLVELTFKAAGQELVDVHFEERRGATTRVRKEKLEVRQVLGSARFLGTEQTAEDVETGFMGMRGNLRVLVEEGTGLPVEIRGRSKGIGRLTVRLRRVVLDE